MTESGFRVALLGATGAVGGEILGVLEERAFPVRSLRVFASERSEGQELEFQGEALIVEVATPQALADCELVFVAAPDVLEPLLPGLGSSWVIDVSGTLELESSVPLFLPGLLASVPAEGGRRLAIPRGCVAGLALALAPLQEEVGLERVTAIALESASGGGRLGIEELTDQTVQLLNAMTGEEEEARAFPRPLAFDCLPQVGTGLSGDETSEERRLVHVLRRVLNSPGLRVETTRVRVPIFAGSLVCVHAELTRDLQLERIRTLWEKHPNLELMSPGSLPTPRSVAGRDRVRLGRIRLDAGSPRQISFVIALDDLRFGSALAAVLAAESRCRLH